MFIVVAIFLVSHASLVRAQETNSIDPISDTLSDISHINKADMSTALGIIGAPQGSGGGGTSLDIYKIISYLIFGGIGFVAFIYGKKNSLYRAMILGIALNIYPYFISSTLWIYIVGIALTALLFIWRD